MTIGLAISLLVGLLVGCSTVSSGRTTAVAAVGNQPAIEEEWGIKILGIRQSAAGYMLDFRYRVIAADKALPIFDRQVKPYLIDQASGARFAVPNPPKTGPLRSSNFPIEGRNYFMFFANPGRYVATGNLVTVVIGDFRAENLRVE